MVSDQSIILPRAGGTYRFVAEVRDTKGNRVPAKLSWVSSDPSIVTVDHVGAATARADHGSVSITVAAPGVPAQLASVIVATPGPHTVMVPSQSVISTSATAAVLAKGPATDGISVGDVVVSGSKGGLLATVTGSHPSATAHMLDTSPASLAQAFERLSVDLATLPVQGTMTADQGHVSVRLDQVQPSGHAVNVTAADANGAVSCQDAAGAPVSVTSSGLGFSTPVKFNLHAVLDIEMFSVKRFELTAAATAAVHMSAGSVSFRAEGEVSFTCKVNFPDSIAIPTPVFVGPLELDGEITPSAGIRIGANASSELTIAGPQADDAITSRNGVEYLDGAWRSVQDNTETGLKVTPAATKFDAALKASVDPYFRVDAGFSARVGGVYSAAGINLSYVEATGNFGVSLQSPFLATNLGYMGPQWDTGFELQAGPELALTGPTRDAINNLFKIVGLDFTAVADLEHYDRKFPLASSPRVEITTPDTPTGQGVTLVAHLPEGLAGDTVNFEGFKDAATTGAVMATGTVVGTQTTATWMPDATDTGTYRVVALVSDKLFGPVGLPYASAPVTLTVSGGGIAPSTTTTTTTTVVLGGDGLVTVGGTVGNLQFGKSTQTDVEASAGTPGGTAHGSFQAPGRPDYKALGYDCTSDKSPGRGSLNYGGGAPYCLTVYYLDASTGRLAAFYTASPHFKTTKGTNVGTTSAAAEQREGRQVQHGCDQAIELTDKSAAAWIAIDIQGPPGAPSGPTDLVTDIRSEATVSGYDGGVGLLFC